MNLVKKQYTFYSVMGLIGDIIFYPIILISLICCFILYIEKSANRVPSVFGVSIVCVSSGSMADGGFNVRDFVFLTHNSTKDLRAGDIIAFYYYMDPSDESVNQGDAVLVQSYDKTEKVSSPYILPEPTKEKTNNRKTLTEVSSKNASVYFHRIVNIFVTDDGTLFFQTQGDSNSNPDIFLICEDYVVGEYSYTPAWLRGIFNFITTTTGIFLLVFLPLSVLVLFIMFSIIEQISNIYTERKVLKGELKFNSKEALEANIGIQMQALDKIEFFIKSHPRQRLKIAQFLWGYLKSGKKKDITKYEQIMFVTEIFEENPKHFWLYWINNTKSKSLKSKIEKLWENWSLQK